MLSVAVDARDDVVVAVERVAETGLDGAADAEVERQSHDARSSARRGLPGAVARRVVDHDDVELRVERANLVDHAADRSLLVVRRDDRELLHAGTPTPTAASTCRARCR